MSFLKKEITMPKLGVPKFSAPSRPRRPAHGPRPAVRPSGGRRSPAARASGVTGLEIGALQLVAAQASVTDGRIVAHRALSRGIPAGLVKDGLVLDPKGLGAELQAFFAETRLNRRVRVGLATPRTILRVIDLPPLAEEDVPAALVLQARDRIPMPLESAVLDHQTVGLVDTPDGQRLRVIVVATERTAVDNLLQALRHGGLKPVGIDLSMFAAIRAVAETASDRRPVLYAQLGDLVNLAIAENDVCHFTRQAPQGLAYVLNQLSELRGISIDEARALLFTAASEGSAADPADMREIGALLHRVAMELGAELRAATEFYGTQSGLVVGHGVVTGSLAPLQGFVPALAEASGLELRCGEVAADAQALQGLDPRVAPVAVGLSVGSLGR